MKFEVDVLFPGFSGKLPLLYHGWGTWALIKTENRNILLDTGFVGLRLNYADILAQRNLTCDDIDMVLLTHMHYDHAANLDLLKNAEIVLSADEWAHANDLEKRDFFIEENAVITLRHAKRKRFIKKDGEEIIPGITAMFVPGHTPGSTAYVLHQENGEKWILAGDAAKNRGEIKTEDVQKLAANREANIAGIKKIKAAADRILPGHDGWITIRNGEVIPEGGNDIHFEFAQGVTVNGGKTELVIRMD